MLLGRRYVISAQETRNLRKKEEGNRRYVMLSIQSSGRGKTCKPSGASRPLLSKHNITDLWSLFFFSQVLCFLGQDYLLRSKQCISSMLDLTDNPDFIKLKIRKIDISRPSTRRHRRYQRPPNWFLPPAFSEHWMAWFVVRTLQVIAVTSVQEWLQERLTYTALRDWSTAKSKHCTRMNTLQFVEVALWSFWNCSMNEQSCRCACPWKVEPVRYMYPWNPSHSSTPFYWFLCYLFQSPSLLILNSQPTHNSKGHTRDRQRRAWFGVGL